MIVCVLLGTFFGVQLNMAHDNLLNATNLCAPLKKELASCIDTLASNYVGRSQEGEYTNYCLTVLKKWGQCKDWFLYARY